MLLGLLQLFRPLNLLLGAISIVISASILEVENPLIILQTALVVVFLNAAANAFNDYMDFEADTINRPNRPLPKEKISKKFAIIATILLFVTGITLSAFLNRDAFIIVSLITVPLMIAYSLWFKGWPLIGNIVVSLILGLAFIFAGVAFDNPWGLIVPALLAFGFTLLRELVKDIADNIGFSIAGGGDTLAAIDKYGIVGAISYISTGGGAFLEFVEGKKLPAVAVLERRAANRI